MGQAIAQKLNVDPMQEQRAARTMLAYLDAFGARPAEGDDPLIDKLVAALVETTKVEPSAADLRKARREARLAKVAAVPATGLMTALGVALTEVQELTLNNAERLHRGSRTQRQLAAKLTRDVQAKLVGVVEKNALESRLAETQALATMRGDEIIQERASTVTFLADERGMPIRGDDRLPLVRGERAVRTVRLCGLMSLARAGSLSDGQVRIGLAYRVLVEQAPTALRSGLAERVGGPTGMSSSDGMVVGELLHAYANLRLRKIDAAVVTAFGAGSREHAVLLAVAVEGRSVRSISKGGNANTANVSALVRALEVVGQAMAIKRPGGACESGNT